MRKPVGRDGVVRLPDGVNKTLNRIHRDLLTHPVNHDDGLHVRLCRGGDLIRHTHTLLDGATDGRLALDRPSGRGGFNRWTIMAARPSLANLPSVVVISFTSS
jgi:hypothetical protein